MSGWREKICLAVSVLLIVFVSIVGWAMGSLPAPREEKRLAGLSDRVEVLFDAEGIPYIYADDSDSAAFAIGYAHARDRMWQMELQRRLAQGRLSELFGERTLAVDRQYRTLGVYAAAEKSAWVLNAEVRKHLQAYANGVNAWLSDHDGARPVEFLALNYWPEPWSITDSVVWTKLMAIRLSGNYQAELLRARLARSLPRDRIEELWSPYPTAAPITIEPAQRAQLPVPAGADAMSLLALDLPALLLPEPEEMPGASNAWAVGGARTNTGKPILANDPHLGFAAPILWYLAKIVTPEGTVSGATVPGVPYVVVGHNDHLAWGLTATEGDLQDAVFERLMPNDPDSYEAPDGPRQFVRRSETIKVKGGADVEHVARSSRHGPVIVADPTPLDEGRSGVVALQATFLADDDTSIQALHRLNLARNRDEFVTALGDIVAPQINVTYADTDGAIGFYAPGRVPVRGRGDGFYVRSGWEAEEDWTGFVPFAELPHVTNPESGLLVNANNKIIDDAYPHFISRDWDAPFRAERILALLHEKKGKYELQDAVRMQMDTLSLMAKSLLPLMTGFEPQDAAGRRIMSRLRTWNGRMERDLEEPLIFMTWIKRFSRAVYEDELGENLPAFWSIRPLFIQKVLSDDDTGTYWCDDKRTSVIESCRTLLETSLIAALREIELRSGTSEPNDLRWGDAHRAKFDHPLFKSIPVLGAIANLWIETDGGEYTVNRGGMRIVDEADPFAHVHGSGLRAVYDLADLERSRFVIATGQSGHMLSPHYRGMMWLWRDGGFVVLNKTRADLARQSRLRVTLLPR